MRLIERLQEYLSLYKISAYAFEHSCDLSNGYLGKQLKGKGSVGSDILERIKEIYPDLSIVWLITGKGRMLLPVPVSENKKNIPELDDEARLFFTSKDDVICLLHKQIARLELSIRDKDRIIALLGH